VYVVRAEDVTADVALSVTAPPGFGATLSTPVVGPDARTAALTVAIPRAQASGTYTLQVTGAIGDATRGVTVRIRVDSDAPTMPAPRLTALKGSRFDTTSYVARVGWAAATDPTSPITRYQAQVKAGAGAWGAASTTGPATRFVERRIKVGPAYAIRVRAFDGVGNVSTWSEVSQLTTRVVQDGSRLLARTGTWRRSYRTTWSGGSTWYARTKGASLRYAFTGRGLAVVMPYGPGRGRAQIWVDGSLATTVDMYRSSILSRRIVFSRSWASSGSHVVKVVVLGTSRRPRVDVDAFLVIR
jgi:hypothetical protein